MDSKIIVRSLEVHQDPENPDVWAISFIYDHNGHDGDIIRVGSKEEMDSLFQSWTSVGVVGLEHEDVIKLI